jgi:hypothetical protein
MEPTCLDQCFDQLCRGFRIEGLLKGVPAHIFDRDLISPLGAKPPQNLASLGATFGQTNLTDGSSGVRPEILRQEPHSGAYKAGLYRGWRRCRRANRPHRPVQVCQGTGEPKDVRGRLCPPVAFTPVEPVPSATICLRKPRRAAK